MPGPNSTPMPGRGKTGKTYMKRHGVKRGPYRMSDGEAVAKPPKTQQQDDAAK